MQFARSCISVLLLLCVVTYNNAMAPGIKTTVSEGGLSYMKDVGITYLEQSLSTLNIPDQTGEAGTPVGKITYSLSSIVLTSLTLPNSSVDLVPASSALQVTIINAAAHITLNWHYRENGWPHISDSGTADITVSQISVDVEVAIGAANGRPTANAVTSTVTIGKVDIDLHGGTSWLYNLFVNDFSHSIASSASQALSTAIQQEVNNGLEAQLQTLPVVSAINKKLEVDYSLLVSPEITTSYFTLSNKGEFYAIANQTEAPFTAGPLPDTITSDMAQIFISDYVANSVGYSFLTAGLLKVLVTDNMLPASFPLRLNTTFFTDLIPPLAKAYPNDLMELNVYATKSPVVTFAPSGAQVSVLATVEVHVLPTNVNAFTLGVEILCTGTAAMSGLNITGKLSFLNATLSLMYSQIGQFDVSTLQEIVSSLIELGVMPIANQDLATGFPLPTVTGLTFINPTVTFYQDYIGVSTDITYDPSSTTNMAKYKQNKQNTSNNKSVVSIL